MEATSQAIVFGKLWWAIPPCSSSPTVDLLRAWLVQLEYNCLRINGKEIVVRRVVGSKYLFKEDAKSAFEMELIALQLALRLVIL